MDRTSLRPAISHAVVWIAVTGFIIFFVYLDLYKQLDDLARIYPLLHLDFFITLLIVTIPGFCVSIYLRSRELKREMALRQTIERSLDKLSQELWEANKELELKAEQLETSLAHEKEMNELQRSFVSMASHEFRTPLAIIDNTAQRLIRKIDHLSQDDILDKAKTIRIAVKRMTGLMESTLNAAKMEAGKMTIQAENCNLKTLLADCCQQQREISKTHIIHLDYQELPENILADPNALTQIFSNLLSNAVKYSPNAQDIHVKGWVQDQEIIITFQDHGLGIDEEDLPKMFNRFFRAKTSIGIAGTGIGLNLIKMLLEEHNGSIDVTSQKGQGSTFTIRLPYIKTTSPSFDVYEIQTSSANS